MTCHWLAHHLCTTHPRLKTSKLCVVEFSKNSIILVVFLLRPNLIEPLIPNYSSSLNYFPHTANKNHPVMYWWEQNPFFSFTSPCDVFIATFQFFKSGCLAKKSATLSWFSSANSYKCYNHYTPLFKWWATSFNISNWNLGKFEKSCRLCINSVYRH